MEIPETRYATTADGVSIAYQVLGEGPLDIVAVNSAFLSHLELVWEWPFQASIFRGLAERGRLVVFDRRGAGLSDKVSGDHLPTLEARMDDIRAVMEAADCERPVLLGVEDGSSLCLLFAATHPQRTKALVLFNPVSRGLWAPDAPWLGSEEEWNQEIRAVEEGWGTLAFFQALVDGIMPDYASDPEFVRAYARLARNSLSKADAVAAERMWRDTDVRHVLPLVRAPTLSVHLAQAQSTPAEESEYVARQIPGARFAETERSDAAWPAQLLAPVDAFLASMREEEADFDRVLATVLFTDIVGSTEKAAQLGDRAWRTLVEDHHSRVRTLLGRYRGAEVDTAGDGFFATFDGPARAIRCATAIREAVRPLGIEVRVGLHTGEVETINDKVGGIAVNIGARVVGKAAPNEVLVSQTVKDLVAGSGLQFDDAGEHELKGVPDRWRLYRVVG
jgi:class 3 adenylate cyclase/pimeloyl-ACP methyl ester carboxylesterase